MNQDQVKEKLLSIESKTKDFNVVFSGKKSKKVNGLYKPETKEIIIHNKNFDNDNSMMYTAIHEFAHHIQFSASDVPISSKAHTSTFRNILHNLLVQAELSGIYYNPFKMEPQFINLTREIKKRFLQQNGRLMKEFGKILVKAHELCIKYNTSFDDYMNRELCLQTTTAKTIMKCSSRDITPEIGFENMKIVAGIKDPEKARKAEEAFVQGKSPDMVRTQFTASPQLPDKLDELMAEKKRVISTIERLKVKLAQLEDSIAKEKKQ